MPGGTFTNSSGVSSANGAYFTQPTNIGSMTRIVAPINVLLTPAVGAAARKASPGEQILDLQFEIQTYVAKGGVRGQ